MKRYSIINEFIIDTIAAVTSAKDIRRAREISMMKRQQRMMRKINNKRMPVNSNPVMVQPNNNAMPAYSR